MSQEEGLHQIALTRYQVIAPLLDPSLSTAEVRARMTEVLYRQRGASHSGLLSERTLRRWLQAYQRMGFEGLYPKVRRDLGVTRVLSLAVIEAAAALKREVPQRSVRQIIDVLTSEGLARPGAVKRSTLSQHLRALGLMTLSKHQASVRGCRRFRKEHRNCLWQADLKYGPYLPDPARPKKFRRTYLLAFIDDYSRLVVHAEFYVEQKSAQLEHCFKRALLKRGIPDKIYVDHGKIFVSHWLRLACARLTIRHLAAAPYAPESKGKIERFMQRCDEFIAEMTLVQPKTLDALNQLFEVWLEEGYNHYPHSALEGKTPAEVFVADNKQLRYVGMQELQEAFLWEETRKVDKTGCIKYRNMSFDVGPELRGKRVTIRFDPQDASEVQIIVEGKLYRLAHELLINKSFDPRNDPFADAPPDTQARPSRYLQALTNKDQQRRQRKYGATNYRDLGVQDV
jgi:transposase InsO family protein